MPAWDPVKLTAGMPRELRVIESRAIEIRSPALSSMSISLGEGSSLTSAARATS